MGMKSVSCSMVEALAWHSIKCRDQLDATECSENSHTLIKEQAKVIHRKAVNEAKVQAGAKAEVQVKNSPKSRTISKTY